MLIVSADIIRSWLIDEMRWDEMRAIVFVLTRWRQCSVILSVKSLQLLLKKLKSGPEFSQDPNILIFIEIMLVLKNKIDVYNYAPL